MSRFLVAVLTSLSMTVVLEAQISTAVYEFQTTTTGPFSEATILTVPPGSYRINALVAASAEESDFVGAGQADAQLTFSVASLGSGVVVDDVERTLYVEEFGFFCGGFGEEFNDQTGSWISSLSTSPMVTVAQTSEVGSDYTGSLASTAGPLCSYNALADVDTRYQVTITVLDPTDFELEIEGTVNVVGTPGYSSALVSFTVVEIEIEIEIDCGDGIDNDGDGLVDCDDSDCTCVTMFLRGDCNTDGSFDIADTVHNLAYQFSGGAVLCLDAHDVNDDGVIDIGDPVYALAHLFTGGPPPAAPFLTCGSDPTPALAPLGCAQFATCP